MKNGILMQGIQGIYLNGKITLKLISYWVKKMS